MHSCWHCRQSLPQMPAFFERQIKDGVSEEFLAQIKNRIRENETEAVTEHYEQIQIHQTEIANYEKKQGTCVITFQSAVGYLHYCRKSGKSLKRQ